MIRLFWAELSSLCRRRYFWAGAAIMVGYSVFNLAEYYRVVTQWSPEVTVSDGLFDGLMLGAYLLAAVGSMHINADYSHGTIRNKLVVGRSRAAVYLSHLLVLYAAGAAYILAAFAIFYTIGSYILGPAASPEHEAAKLLCALGVLAGLTAVLTLVCMLYTRRPVVIAALLLVFCLMCLAGFLSSQLEEPEYIDNYGGVINIVKNEDKIVALIVDEEGNIISVDDIVAMPNPQYIRGKARNLLGMLIDLNPCGQILQLVGSVERRTPFWVLGLSGLGVAVIAAALGLWAFMRKDLM